MKVLIISHTPINTHNNMGKTMLSLFSSFDKDELCQLYIYPMKPDIDKCNSYFRMTDKDALKRLFWQKDNASEIVITDSDLQLHAMFEHCKDAKVYRNKRNRQPIRMIARDMMWKCSSWYSKNLDAWVARENPDCIFLAPGYQSFIYDIAMKIADKRNIPIISYICDDYYFTSPQKKLTSKLQRYLIRKKISETMKQSSHIVCICDSLKENYEAEFGTSATTIMTGKSLAEFKGASTNQFVKGLTYMGNVRCNRYKNLVEIGQALKNINDRHGTEYELEIYSSESDSLILDELKSVESIRLRGFVSGKEYEETLCSSSILIHTEAFDSESVELVKNSVSTKIADSLSSGVCVLAYGPKVVASMQYLIDTGAAYCVTDIGKLEDSIYELLTNWELRNKNSERALIVAKQNHDEFSNSERLKKLIYEITEF